MLKGLLRCLTLQPGVVGSRPTWITNMIPYMTAAESRYPRVFFLSLEVLSHDWANINMFKLISLCHKYTERPVYIYTCTVKCLILYLACQIQIFILISPKLIRPVKNYKQVNWRNSANSCNDYWITKENTRKNLVSSEQLSENEKKSVDLSTC